MESTLSVHCASMEVPLSLFIVYLSLLVAAICLLFLWPCLGKLIDSKDMARNKYSEKVYRDVAVNVSGMDVANVAGSLCDLVVHCQKVSNCDCMFTFPVSISQSAFGGRVGSNSCTLIAVKFGVYCFQHKVEISLLWNQLPSIWVNSMVNAIWRVLLPT